MFKTVRTPPQQARLGRVRTGVLFGIMAAVTVLAAVVGIVSVTREQRVEILPPRKGPELTSARTWGYQLQNVDAGRVPTEIDMLVVDYSRDGTPSGALQAADVEALRTRADGTRRIVLCYLSIGEAEIYRYYWNRAWAANPPGWLGPENAAWKGNFSVQYWQPDWQRLIVDTTRLNGSLVDRLIASVTPQPKPYLDRIIEAGFDGVYLDRVDAFEKATGGEAQVQARAAMVRFITKISSYAKTRKPGFLVVPQNGEELLADARMRSAIDAIAKEDLFYGEKGDGVANAPNDTRHTIAMLNRTKANGQPVFVIEYLSDANQQRGVADDLRSLGFVGLFAERSLKSPPSVFPELSFQDALSGPKVR